MSPFDVAWAVLKGYLPNKPEIDYDAYQAAEGNSEEQQAIQHQHIRNMLEYYSTNPPQWTRDDWPEIRRLSNEQGGWPPPGTPGVDYPHVADHEWDEWDDWEQHQSYTEQGRKWQEEEEAQRQAEEQAAAERAAAQEAARQQSKSGWKHGWVKGQRR